jgi:hypothetical protein
MHLFRVERNNSLFPPSPPMRLSSSARSTLAAALTSILGAPLAGAQLVTPRTIPVMQDEQFEIYPRSRPGLGPLSIAVDDTLGDPFSNPAKATRLRGFTITSAPFSHGYSQNRGGGRTLPVGILASSGEWAGAVLGAIQELDRVGPVWNRPTSEQTATNQYFTAILARRLAPGLSVGVSAFRADLDLVDGVDLLYAGSDRIDQNGSVTDVRVGATKEWNNGHTMELLVLRNVTDMRHDVRFSTWNWNPVTRIGTTTTREEVNLDQTKIWGAHTEYTLPVGKEGWRVGGLLTANRLSHPKIPNYVIQNIPRDPGNTSSFNVGIGAARTNGAFTFGFDAILEPMTSDTWADSPTDLTRSDGTILKAGQKTIENHFDFHNSKARMGIGHTWGRDTSSSGQFGLDFGLSMYAISYDLAQMNNVSGVRRKQHERWVESGPTFGARYRTRDVEISYTYRSNCGSDGCDFPGWGGVSVQDSAPVASAGGIIAAPSAPLFIQGVSARSHHFSISVPIR